MRVSHFSLLAFLGLFLLSAAPLKNSDYPTTPAKDKVLKVIYAPHLKKVSYNLLVNGQRRQVIYQAQGKGLLISVKRPKRSTLQLRVRPNTPTNLNKDWDEISRYALGRHLLIHRDLGIGSLQESESSSFGLPVVPTVKLLGNIKIFNCKTKASCECSNGAVVNLTCKCGESAICTESKVIVEKQTPDGGTTKEEKFVCAGTCGSI